MIAIKDFMEIVDYRITEGSTYGWTCYGPNAYCLDSWNGDQEGHTVSITFDTKTQEVFEAVAYDYRNERAYRMINPAYAEAHKEESKQRNVDIDVAWEKDDGSPLKFVDLESGEDFITKATAIVAGEDYDTRVTIPLDLPDDVLFELFKLAHEKDMTFNKFLEEVLSEKLEQMKQDLDELGEDAFRSKYSEGC
jgi:hypothetical protein